MLLANIKAGPRLSDIVECLFGRGIFNVDGKDASFPSFVSHYSISHRRGMEVSAWS